MRSFFRRLSIGGKLVALGLATCGATLLLTIVSFTVYEVGAFRDSLVREVRAEAEVVALNALPALVFRDEAAATETLSVLRNDRRVVFAGVFSGDGRLFASYTRDAGAALPPLPSPGVRQASSFVDVVSRLGADAGAAFVFIRADTLEMRRRLGRYVSIGVGVLVTSLGLAWLVARRLQSVISGPVLALVGVAQAVSRRKDYALRAPVSGEDELGALASSFNDMLAQIQRRDEDLRSLNDELSRRTQELARKNEEVEGFVYIVSHDLRGPLVNLQGFSRELREGCHRLGAILEAAPLEPGPRREAAALLDRQIPEALRFISASVEKFERLISALLRLSRLGRQEYRLETLDTDALVASTLDSLRASIAASGASVVAAPGLPAVRGDATAVGQVFSNLVSNAIQYLRPGVPGRVEIRGRLAEGTVHLEVEDNGAGIPEVARPRLFQVFQRFHPDLAPGEGMGLAAVKRIVERHGGRLWAESREGAGSTFHVTFPAPAPEGAP